MPDHHAVLAAIYQQESRKVFATLVRLVGDFDLAEDCLHEAFAAALAQWPSEGVPDNPAAWLVSVGRFKATDIVRRKSRHEEILADIGDTLAPASPDPREFAEAGFRDDQLRLIFTCCHPALSPEHQVALTLREVCGRTTEEVASAFLVSDTAMAQRIVRAKAKIRKARIPYVVPSVEDLPERLESVLSVIYLVFNEGYSASSGQSLTRPDLCREAIHLGRILLDLHADAEVLGLLALMLLHDSRRAARAGEDGRLILLEDQDRGLWNRAQISEGTALVEQAMETGVVGSYTLQAAIAAVHAEAESTEATDWAQIVTLYDLLLQAMPSPVVELNRAVAVAMRDGAEAGLDLVEGLLARGVLADYHLAHSARGFLCNRLGRTAQARAAYEQALSLTKQDPERRFLEERIQDLG